MDFSNQSEMRHLSLIGRDFGFIDVRRCLSNSEPIDGCVYLRTFVQTHTWTAEYGFLLKSISEKIHIFICRSVDRESREPTVETGRVHNGYRKGHHEEYL